MLHIQFINCFGGCIFVKNKNIPLNLEITSEILLQITDIILQAIQLHNLADFMFICCFQLMVTYSLLMWLGHDV